MSKADDLARAQRVAQLSAMESSRGVVAGPVDLASGVIGTLGAMNGGSGRSTSAWPDVQDFAVDGTWTKPAGATVVIFQVQGSGGPHFGFMKTLTAAELGATEAVTVADGVGIWATTFAGLTDVGVLGVPGRCLVVTW